jgi:hypothetical protein
MVLVFSQGKWLDIALPRIKDRFWSQDNTHIYAVAVQQFRLKGFSETRAAQLGEAYVYKRISKGLKYDDHLERDLSLLETA